MKASIRFFSPLAAMAMVSFALLGFLPVLAASRGPRHAAFIPVQIPDNDSASRARRGSPLHRVYPLVPIETDAWIQRRRPSSAPLYSSSPDAIVQNSDSNGSSEGTAQTAELDEALRLRERARSLRLEAVAAEQSLRSTMQQKKDAEDREADELIDMLLGSSSTSAVSLGEPDEKVAGESASKTAVSSSSNNNIPSAQTLALRIKEKTLGIVKLKKVAERLHERETTMMMGPEGYLSKAEPSIDGDNAAGGGGFMLGDYENNSLERKKEEADRISGLLDQILEAVQLIDDEGAPSNAEQAEGAQTPQMAPKLRVRVGDLRQNRDALIKRRVDNLANASLKRGPKKDASIDGYTRSSIDGDDSSDGEKEEKSKEEKMMARLIETPTWLPPSLAAFAATSPVEVSVSDWKAIKTDLLADSRFRCTSWDATDVAALYRGGVPRAPINSEADDDGEQSDNSITAIFEDIQNRLRNHAVLKDRVQLFLIDDYEWRPPLDTMGNFGQSMGGWDADESPPPVIVALAKEAEPEQESERGLDSKALAAFSTLATVFTALAYALSAFALNPTLFDAIVKL